VRRAIFWKLTVLVLAMTGTRVAHAQWQVANDSFEVDGDFEYVDDMGVVRRRMRTVNTEEQRREMVRQVLQTALDLQKGDAWKWRDGVEDRLTSLGGAYLPALRNEMQYREGYEGDALQVAVFRLENLPLDPNEALVDWAQKRFGLTPAAGAAQVKVTRVLGIGGEAEIEDGALFPHHLFYCVEFVPKHVRVPVALAADGKVQPVEEDGALLRFIQREVEAQRTEVGRQRLALAVARIALARTTTVYKPDSQQVEGHAGESEAVAAESVTARVNSSASHQMATLTFGATGAVQALVTTQEKEPEKVLPPVVVPAGNAPPPPPMPMLEK
jgi:hypothetical protein